MYTDVLFCRPSWSDKVNAVKVVVGRKKTPTSSISPSHTCIHDICVHASIEHNLFLHKMATQDCIVCWDAHGTEDRAVAHQFTFHPAPPLHSLSHTHAQANPHRHFTITLCDSTLSFHSPITLACTFANTIRSSLSG